MLNLYNPRTHKYQIIDNTILFRDKRTGYPNNPKGPVAINLSDPMMPIIHAVVDTYNPALEPDFGVDVDMASYQEHDAVKNDYQMHNPSASRGPRM